MTVRRFFSSLLILFLFVLLPVVLFLVDVLSERWVREEEVAEQVTEAGWQKIEELSRATSNQVQMRVMLERFFLSLARLAETQPPERLASLACRLYERDLRPALPPHDLAMYRVASTTLTLTPIIERTGPFGLVPEVIADYFRVMIRIFAARTPEYRHRLASSDNWDDKMNRVRAGVPEDLKVRMERCLGFPSRAEFFLPQVMMGFQVLNLTDSSRGVFMQTFPRRMALTRPPKYAFAAMVDLTQVPGHFWIRQILRTYRGKRVGIGFFPQERGRPILSSFWRAAPELVAEVGAVIPRTAGQKWAFEAFNHRIFIDQQLLPGGYRLVMAEPIMPAPALEDWGARLRQAGVIGLVWFGIFLLWQIHVRGKEPRLAVAAILLGTFVTGTLPFLSGIQAIARFSVFEEFRRGKQEGVRGLHERLTSFDQESLTYLSRIFSAIRFRSTEEATGKAFFREERLATETPLLEILIRRILKRMPWTQRTALNGVAILIGPDGFLRGCSSLSHQRKGSPDILKLLVPITRRIWEVHFRGAPTSNRAGEGVSKKDLEFEMVRDHLREMLGGDTWLKLLFLPWRQMELRMNIGYLTMVTTLVKAEGKERYLLFYLWDEVLANQGLADRFGEFKKTGPEESYFMTSSREQSFVCDPPGIERFPDLQNLVQRARDTGRSLQETVLRNGSREVMEAYKSRVMSDHHFAGRQVVRDKSGLIRTRLIQTVLLLGALVVLIAAWATNLFTKPFQRILEAMRLFRPDADCPPLPEAVRSDEFGTLATAFNGMMKGLRERELLGQYVSGSVKRLVVDAEFHRSAVEGMLRDVTVVFTGLKGFEEFQEKESPETVYRVMDEHLSVVAAVVNECGGEVSKVIGEKILIVFDHAEFPRREEAAGAAVLASLRLRERLAGFPLELITGITSGEVIAGIIGSPDVRRDYTVIGDTVNLASRLSVLAYITEKTRIVVSGVTVRLLGPGFKSEKLPFKRVKGKTQEVEAFLIAGGPPS